METKVKEGEWRFEIDDTAWMFFKKRWVCSECGEWQTYGETPYCPYCGTKMKVKKKSWEVTDNEEIQIAESR